MAWPYGLILGKPLVEQLPYGSQQAIIKACKVIPGFQGKFDQLTEYWVKPNADKDIAGTMLYNVLKLLVAYNASRPQ